jgi:hypothetical protein
MMIWMAVDIDVHSNGKVLALAERLDVSADEAVGIMLLVELELPDERDGALPHRKQRPWLEGRLRLADEGR